MLAVVIGVLGSLCSACGGSSGQSSHATVASSSDPLTDAAVVEAAFEDWFSSDEFMQVHGPAKPMHVACEPTTADFDGHTLYQCPAEFDDRTTATWCGYVADGLLFSNGRQDNRAIDCLAHSEPAQQ